MGKLSTTDTDLARSAASGTLTALGSTPACALNGRFNLSIWGAFSATVALERSFDGGATWINCSRSDGTNNSLSAAYSGVIDEIESGVLYRLTCTGYTSGTVNWRMSQ